MIKLKIKDHSNCSRSLSTRHSSKERKSSSAARRPKRFKTISDWTKTEEYQEKNFARQHIKINPVKACQPLGALYCALGFEDTLPFCQAPRAVSLIFEPSEPPLQGAGAAVSSSMTEDAAVFGGLNNMTEGLENAYALYKPKMDGDLTSCIAGLSETI